MTLFGYFHLSSYTLWYHLITPFDAICKPDPVFLLSASLSPHATPSWMVAILGDSHIYTDAVTRVCDWISEGLLSIAHFLSNCLDKKCQRTAVHKQ